LANEVSPIFPKTINIVTAEQAGFPLRGLRRADGNNFDPRLGLAWRPFGNARSVIRAGWGVYRNQLSSSTFGPISGSGPFTSDENFTNSISNGRPLFQFPEPFLAVGSLGTQDVNALAVDMFNPYTMQWNLTVEQEFAGTGLRASYLGTRSVNLLYRRNFNQPLPSTTPFNNDRRPYPQYRNSRRGRTAGTRCTTRCSLKPSGKWRAVCTTSSAGPGPSSCRTASIPASRVQ
jgi:hypothetical protein